MKENNSDKKNRKLVLSRQTIRTLNDAALTQVVGGGSGPLKQTNQGATCGFCYQ